MSLSDDRARRIAEAKTRREEQEQAIQKQSDRDAKFSSAHSHLYRVIDDYKEPLDFGVRPKPNKTTQKNIVAALLDFAKKAKAAGKDADYRAIDRETLVAYRADVQTAGLSQEGVKDFFDIAFEMTDAAFAGEKSELRQMVKDYANGDPEYKPVWFYLNEIIVKAVWESTFLPNLFANWREAKAAADPANRPNKPKPRGRGRPSDTDHKQDKKLFDAWNTGSYKTFDDLGNAFHISRKNAQNAVERHRKRVERNGNG